MKDQRIVAGGKGDVYGHDADSERLEATAGVNATATRGNVDEPGEARAGGTGQNISGRTGDTVAGKPEGNFKPKKKKGRRVAV
jgi:hypothetical protein